MQEGDYGKQRMWGAIGWGGFSIVAGAVITKYGLHSSFYAYLGAAVIALGPTALLPVQALQKKHPELAPREDSHDAGTIIQSHENSQPGWFDST